MLSQAAPPAPARDQRPGWECGGDAEHPQTPLRSPPASKPRGGGTGGVREVCADSPAITQRKENTTRHRINSSGTSEQTAPGKGHSSHHSSAGSPWHWAVPPREREVWVKTAQVQLQWGHEHGWGRCFALQPPQPWRFSSPRSVCSCINSVSYKSPVPRPGSPSGEV